MGYDLLEVTEIIIILVAFAIETLIIMDISNSYRVVYQCQTNIPIQRVHGEATLRLVLIKLVQ